MGATPAWPPTPAGARAGGIAMNRKSAGAGQQVLAARKYYAPGVLRKLVPPTRKSRGRGLDTPPLNLLLESNARTVHIHSSLCTCHLIYMILPVLGGITSAGITSAGVCFIKVTPPKHAGRGYAIASQPLLSLRGETTNTAYAVKHQSPRRLRWQGKSDGHGREPRVKASESFIEL